MYFADPHPAFIGVVGKGQHEDLERDLGIDRRGWDLPEDRIQQRRNVRAGLVEV